MIIILGDPCQLGRRGSSAKSSCRIPCETDDDCVNHGRHMCCPTLPGSNCKGECVTADPDFDRTRKSKCKSRLNLPQKLKFLEMGNASLLLSHPHVILNAALCRTGQFFKYIF